jgi:hypothetical protein
MISLATNTEADLFAAMAVKFFILRAHHASAPANQKTLNHKGLLASNTETALPAVTDGKSFTHQCKTVRELVINK